MKQVTLTQLEVLDIASLFQQIQTCVDVISEHKSGYNDEVNPDTVLENIRQLATAQQTFLMDKALGIIK